MSDNTPNKATGWTDHDLLVCLISVIEHSGATLDIKGAKYPVGRNACGFKQKYNHLKKALRPELDAIQAGIPFDGATPTTKKTATPKKAVAPKAATQRKRKASKSDDESEEPPKKRGRPKKAIVEAREDSGAELSPDTQDEFEDEDDMVV